MNDWPNWVWAMLIMQGTIVWALYRLEKLVKHQGKVLVDFLHPPTD